MKNAKAMASIELKYDARNPIARKTIEYVLSLGLFEEVQAKKMTFEEAAKACNAISVDEFVDEAKRQIREHFKNA